MPKRAIGWKEIQGDQTAALDWPIDEDSIVFEIGGYEGRWALQMAEKYNPHLYVFEPQDWAFEKAKQTLKEYNKSYLSNLGLWTHDEIMPLGDYGRDGASLLKPYHEDIELVKVRDIATIIDDIMGTTNKDIDVCLMNIEGGEFVLIPYMIGMGIMKRIKFFWAQFHLFVPNSKRKFAAINEAMEDTHDVYWDFGMSMKCWKRREND